ncbi:MAG TPA: hypothetical protein VGY99_11440 [Candidatus Binataceae bacterium]|jgi:hypothetical protein|nr:hypothetical protein [Candidatus Binataceae bacterium]
MDRAKTIAAGPSRGITVTHATGNVGHPGTAVYRDQLDPFSQLIIEPADQHFAVRGMENHISCELARNDRRAPGIRIVKPCGLRRARGDPAGFTDPAAVGKGNRVLLRHPVILSVISTW